MSQTGGMLCWWPGLASLWRFGRVGGLLTAVAFALLLNGAVVATFVFPEVISQQIRYPAWFVLLVGWWWSMRASQGLANIPPDRAVVEVNEGLFLQAQAEYLKGHWFEAETPLRVILKSDPEDVDARLLLVGLLRHSARYDEARRQLKRLGKMPRARKWEAEINREIVLLPTPSRAAATPRGLLAADELGGSHPDEKLKERLPSEEEKNQGEESPGEESPGEESPGREALRRVDRAESDEYKTEGDQQRMRRAA